MYERRKFREQGNEYIERESKKEENSKVKKTNKAKKR